ncbi:copper resistance CopC/CopD family protein [Paenibacillus gansuensis]|uniref:Copper resistance CopC/CopD family protein n=1 Tax=Paenibacillus gansuensis TaxID=306542 RepID=A0ABW5P8W1_9BACL
MIVSTGKKPIRIPSLWTIVLLIAVMFSMLGWAAPGTISAHAALTGTAPAADARLEQAPAEVKLTFNEPLESELYSISVWNARGKEIGGGKATLSEDRRELTKPLPKTGTGVYTVSYRVISADGHPVEGAYIFTVGNPPASEEVPLFPIEGHELHEGNHAGHHNSQVSWDMSLREYVQFGVRIAYYAALLMLAGWVLWTALLPRGSQELQTSMKDGLLQAQRAQLLLLLLYVFVHGLALVDTGGTNLWLKLLTGTDVGRSWLISLVWSMLGFVLIGRNKIIDAVWMLGLLGAKAMTGHAAGFDPKVYTVGLNFLHLFGSAVWVGGVTLLMLQWRKLGEVKSLYVASVSRGALWSIVLLIVTGILSTLAFLPKIEYVLYTQWGEFLIVKTVLVLIVLIIGAYIRGRMKRNKPLSELLKLDAVVMALIIAVVGIFTYISPLPANEPFYYHEMGEKQHGTMSISPNVPGTNEFIVKVFLPENTGEPKNITLRLHPLDKPESGAITVPVKPYKDEEVDSFTGFTKYTYKVSGPYLPFAGKWLVELRVQDPEDNEKVYKQEMRVY